MGQTRIQVVALAALFSVGVGVMAVQTSPNCQRLVRNYVTVPVRNRVSKATALAWAKWRVGHPNWKPKPGVTRPKYLMSRKETIDKVAFSCEAPTIPSQMDTFFTPTDFDGPPPALDLTPMETTQITFPNLIPPDVEGPPIPGAPETTDTSVIFVPPYIPPVFEIPTGPLPPPVVVPAPEPASFFLVALGMVGGWLLWLRRPMTPISE